MLEEAGKNHDLADLGGTVSLLAVLILEIGADVDCSYRHGCCCLLRLPRGGHVANHRHAACYLAQTVMMMSSQIQTVTPQMTSRFDPHHHPDLHLHRPHLHPLQHLHLPLLHLPSLCRQDPPPLLHIYTHMSVQQHILLNVTTP